MERLLDWPQLSQGNKQRTTASQGPHVAPERNSGEVENSLAFRREGPCLQAPLSSPIALKTGTAHRTPCGTDADCLDSGAVAKWLQV